MFGVIKKMARVIVALSIGMAITFSAKAGQSFTTLNLGQVTQDENTLHIYINTFDENGRWIRGLSNDDISLTAGRSVLTTEISEIGEHEPLACVIVIDVSESLSEEQFEMIKESLNSFIRSISGESYVALLAIDETVEIVTGFTNDKEILTEALARIKITGKNNRFYQGLTRALDIARGNDENLPKRRAVLVLGDCIDDYHPSGDLQETREKINETKIPVYAAGITSEDPNALNIIGELARMSGGTLIGFPADEIASTLDSFRNFLYSGYHINAIIPDDFADGSSRSLRLSVTAGGVSLDAYTDMRFSPLPTPPPEPSQAEESSSSLQWLEGETTGSEWGKDEIKNVIRKHLTVIIIALVLIASVICLVLILSSKKKKQKLTPEKTPVPLRNDGFQNFGKSKDNPYESLKDSPEAPKPKIDDIDEMDGATVLKPLEMLDQDNDLYSDSTVFKKPSPGIFVTLKISGESGENTLKHRVSDKITIGRDDRKCKVVLKDPKISGVHCELSYLNGKITVRDLGSTNKTTLNGEIVTDTRNLSSGDQIEIGDTFITVVF